MKWFAIGAAALVATILMEDGWVEAVAAVELAVLVGVVALTKRWSDRHAERVTEIADEAIESLTLHRAYGQRVTDVNAQAVAALSEYDREEAARIAGEFLDAYAVYREHAPSKEE